MDEHDHILEELMASVRGVLNPYFAESDPSAYVDTYTDEITYFDPWSGGKLAGRAARDHLMSFAGAIPPVGYEIVDPAVQVHGDVAVLTLNVALLDPETGDRVAVWNTTQIHDRSVAPANLVHAHWSYAEAPVEAPS